MSNIHYQTQTSRRKVRNSPIPHVWEPEESDEWDVPLTEVVLSGSPRETPAPFVLDDEDEGSESGLEGLEGLEELRERLEKEVWGVDSEEDECSSVSSAGGEGPADSSPATPSEEKELLGVTSNLRSTRARTRTSYVRSTQGTSFAKTPLSDKQLDIVLSCRKGQYSQLGDVTLPLLEVCNDPDSALLLNAALRRLPEGKNRVTLHSLYLEGLLGKNYKRILEKNSHILEPILGRNGKPYYVYSEFSKTGHGISITYKVKVRRRKKQPMYTVSGAHAARWHRSNLRAEMAQAARETDQSRFYESQAHKLSLDLEEARKHLSGPEDEKALSNAIAILNSKKKATIEQTGRIHTPIVKISRRIRPWLLLSEKPMVSYDIEMAHASFLFLYASLNWNLPQEEIEFLRNVRRNKPPALTAWLNDVAGRHSLKEVETYFEKPAPVFHKCFSKHRRELRRAMSKVYASLETQIMVGLDQVLQHAGMRDQVGARTHDGEHAIPCEGFLEIQNKYLTEIGNGFLFMKEKCPFAERADAIKEFEEERTAKKAKAKLKREKQQAKAAKGKFFPISSLEEKRVEKIEAKFMKIEAKERRKAWRKSQ